VYLGIIVSKWSASICGGDSELVADTEATSVVSGRHQDEGRDLR
jgi:hypothetical protein